MLMAALSRSFTKAPPWERVSVGANIDKTDRRIVHSMVVVLSFTLTGFLNVWGKKGNGSDRRT